MVSSLTNVIELTLLLEIPAYILESSTETWYYSVDLGKKHYATYNAIFEKPDRKDVDWDDFIALLTYIGAVLKHQSGSAVGVRLNGIYAVFHKPHPSHEIYLTDLKRIRRFLKEAGIHGVE